MSSVLQGPASDCFTLVPNIVWWHLLCLFISHILSQISKSPRRAKIQEALLHHTVSSHMTTVKHLKCLISQWHKTFLFFFLKKVTIFQELRSNIIWKSLNMWRWSVRLLLIGCLFHMTTMTIGWILLQQKDRTKTLVPFQPCCLIISSYVRIPHVNLPWPWTPQSARPP